MKPAALADVSLYLIAVMAGTIILAFWVLPSLISALCPLGTREVLRDLQGALVIAVVTSLSVVALSFIQQATKKLADRLDIQDENRGEIIKTTIAVSYPLGQLRNYSSGCSCCSAPSTTVFPFAAAINWCCRSFPCCLGSGLPALPSVLSDTGP